MNDITALMASMKAAALKAKSEANEWGYDTDAFHDEATPDAVIELVEALEAEQQKSANQGRHACELFDEVKQLQEQLRTVELSNSVLESRTVTVKLPKRIENIDLRSPLEVEDMWIYRFKNSLAAAGIQVIEGEGQ